MGHEIGVHPLGDETLELLEGLKTESRELVHVNPSGCIKVNEVPVESTFSVGKNGLREPVVVKGIRFLNGSELRKRLRKDGVNVVILSPLSRDLPAPESLWLSSLILQAFDESGR